MEAGPKPELANGGIPICMLGSPIFLLVHRPQPSLEEGYGVLSLKFVKFYIVKLVSCQYSYHHTALYWQQEASFMKSQKTQKQFAALQFETIHV